MKKNRKKIIAIITLILIILLAIFIWNNISIENNVDEYQDYTPEEEISEEQMRQTIVSLYFKYGISAASSSARRLSSSESV